MPSADSPALIVARFLRSNNYLESYEAFIQEAGLPSSAGDVSKNDLTLEVILEEKQAFDLSLRFERLGEEEGSTAWTTPAPSIPTSATSLPTKSNLLHVSIENAAGDGDVGEAMLFATTADRRLNILDLPALTLEHTTSTLHDSPVLSTSVLLGKYLLSTSMSGNLVLSDLQGRILERRKDHNKFVVQVVTFKYGDEWLIATIGWDNKAIVYRITGQDIPTIGEPICTIELQTKPEAVLFLQHPVDLKPLLLISRTDSSFLHYYTIDQDYPRLIGRQNLAPHSNAWVAFTPSAMAISPVDPTLLAIATSTVPHMKLIIVKLLIPAYNQENEQVSSTTAPSQLLDSAATPVTQASQARAELAIAEREAAAIQILCSTFAPQTAYSTPAIAWRPDASGVWVNGDDGIVRGLEASTGKVVATLKSHEAGTKVRCLCTGSTHSDGVKQEWLVTGGFDQQLLVWRTV